MVFFRTVLSIIFGWLCGSLLNMGLVKLGHNILPINDVDVNDLEALASVTPTLSAEFFVFPFLAHALGTLLGGGIATIIAIKNKMRSALIVAIIFLIGGIMVNTMISGPLWFTITDIMFAYIPMGWIGGKIGIIIQKKHLTK